MMMLSPIFQVDNNFFFVLAEQPNYPTSQLQRSNWFQRPYFKESFSDNIALLPLSLLKL